MSLEVAKLQITFPWPSALRTDEYNCWSNLASVLHDLRSVMGIVK